MKSHRWTIALGSLVLLSMASAWSVESPPQAQLRSQAPKTAAARSVPMDLLADASDRQQCVVAIKLCWQQCKAQYTEYSDKWKACRDKCGNPGNCD